jgi:hypothetical protein
VGRSQDPHEPHYSETGAGCQCGSLEFAAIVTTGFRCTDRLGTIEAYPVSCLLTSAMLLTLPAIWMLPVCGAGKI